MPELRVVAVSVEQCVRAIRLDHIALGDGVSEAPAIGLAESLDIRHVTVTGIPAAVSTVTSG